MYAGSKRCWINKTETITIRKNKKTEDFIMKKFVCKVCGYIYEG